MRRLSIPRLSVRSDKSASWLERIVEVRVDGRVEQEKRCHVQRGQQGDEPNGVWGDYNVAVTKMGGLASPCDTQTRRRT